MSARVLHIFVARRKGEPVQEVERVEALPGRGLEGDRYWAKKSRRPADEVTLIEIEQIEAFTRDTGLTFEPGAPRRNLVTRGVRLNDLLGKQFAVGEALLEGLELCEPCRLFQRNTHASALEYFEGKAGLRARIVRGGWISKDAAIFTEASRRPRKILVTGSAGHLGEALVRTLKADGNDVAGVDVVASAFTSHVASITDRPAMRARLEGADTVLHAASLHKPHTFTRGNQEFVDVNLSGTLTLLEEAVAAGVRTFVYTSTTSAFGHALQPPAEEPAAWITEDVASIPKNIYGVTKEAAEDLCALFHGKGGMRVLALRTSRFFPEEDDNSAIREGYDDENAKANEFLYRRVDIEDVVSAHRDAMERGAEARFERYIVSATSPFRREDLAELRRDAPAVLKRYFPEYEAAYGARGWRMFPSIDRVYVNDKARRELGWAPRYGFAHVLACLMHGDDRRSPLARAVGSKGYHATPLEGAPFPGAGN
jgi:nucleoside-diphosphate-sugar epimerase/MOSC domain-containing protein YiiM